MGNEILHKISFVIKTPIVKIGVFFFCMQVAPKKAAKKLVFLYPICYNSRIPKLFLGRTFVYELCR